MPGGMLPGLTETWALRDGGWLLMDFSSVVVHVFTDEARKFYDLERLEQLG